MSTSLYWRPAPRVKPPPRELPFQLKKAISERLWDHDGSLHGHDIEIGMRMLPYLEGLADGHVEGAEELIIAIREHDAVVVWIGG